MCADLAMLDLTRHWSWRRTSDGTTTLACSQPLLSQHCFAWTVSVADPRVRAEVGLVYCPTLCGCDPSQEESSFRCPTLCLKLKSWEMGTSKGSPQWRAY